MRDLSAIAPESMLKFIVANKVDLIEEGENNFNIDRD